MNLIKAILADADGTLIEKDNLTEINPALKAVIQQARSTGILFNLASGRPYRDQEQLYHVLVSPDKPKSNEGILYEAAAVKLFGMNDAFVLGGLFSEQLTSIKQYLNKNSLLLDFIPNEGRELGLGYITSQFKKQGVTDEIYLNEEYNFIKSILEKEFPYLEVTRSADAIDIAARGVTKANPTIKYSELTGIPLSNFAAFGDARNDLPMFEVVGKAGGLVVYVGKKKEQEEMVRQYASHFIPEQKGPLGTVEAINYILSSHYLALDIHKIKDNFK